MPSGLKRAQTMRSLVIGFALIITLGATGLTTSASSSPASSYTPTGTTLPPLEAPPTSYRPIFTGAAGVVEKAFRSKVAAYSRKDVDTALALTFQPQSRAAILAFMNTYSFRLHRILTISVKGTKATIDFEYAIVGRNLKLNVTTLLQERNVWTRVNGVWKDAGGTVTAPGIPLDLASVKVMLPDGTPIMVTEPLPETGFAFLLKNTGSLAKGVFILGIPARLNVATLIPKIGQIGDERSNNVAAQLPDGVLELGATADIPPQAKGTMVFSGRLPRGRYLLISRTAGTGTLLPNEYAVFTVS